MSGGPGVGSRLASGLFGQIGREALVKALDGNFERCAQQQDELLRLPSLLSMLPPHRQGQTDDDPLGAVLANELGDSGEPALASRLLHDPDRSRDRPGRIGDSDARARRAVVEGENLQSAEAISLLPTSYASMSPSGFLPPA